MNSWTKNKSLMYPTMLTDRNLEVNINISTDMLNVMVMNAVKCTEKSNGASFDDICKYVEETYHVNVEPLKLYINETLVEGVDNGMFDEISASYVLEKEGRKRKIFVEKRFRVKGNFEVESQNLLLRDEMNSESKTSIYDYTPSNVKLEITATSPPTRGMVITMLKNSMKNFNKRYGASFNEICKNMEEKYQVDMEMWSSYVENILEECVDTGKFEKIRRAANMEERYRINEKGSVKTESHNFFLNDEMNPKTKRLVYDSTTSNVKLDGIKAATSPPTRGMVIMMLQNSMKNLNKRNGTCFEEVSKHIEEKYQVDMKMWGSYVKNIFEECAANEIFEETSRSANVKERFRKETGRVTKETGSAETEPNNLFLKDEVNLKDKKLVYDSTTSNVELGKKATTCPPTRQMLVMIFKNSMKNLNKCNGASFSEIKNYIEENYQVDMKVFSSYVKNVFEECVEDGMFEKIKSKASEEERFKIKDVKNISKGTENLRVKDTKKKRKK